jgi:RimJ/RimL family protein N-acetyltransferase
LVVELRNVLPADLDRFFEMGQDPEAVWMAAFTHADPGDRAAFDAHWSRIMACPDVRIQTVLLEGEVVGSIASFLMEGDREITYWVDRRFWGCGVATKALAGFVEGEWRPFFGRAAADNVGSRRVMERCGFRLIGTDRGFANARGMEIDEVVYRLD